MANPSHSDMTEEDATNLQFPKEFKKRKLIKQEPDTELEVSVVSEEIFTSDPVCCVCKSILCEPYIKCSICKNITICPLCFSNGREIDEHKNYHDYVIIKNEFPLTEDSSWTAKEELKLLDVLQECGFGNWVDIAKRMPGKTSENCESHYLNYYINEQRLPGLPVIKESEASLFGHETIPYMFKLQDLEEPPRFAPNTLNSRLLAGYNAARSDFEVNFDNYAELLISNLKYDEFDESHEHYDLGRNLQFAIVQGYNSRLKERMRRRRIIREHGLISFRKVISWLQRYDATITRPVAEKFLMFMQLVDGLDFDYIMESLHYAGELRNRIKKLIEFRKNGLKYFHSISIYQKLLKIKQENDKDRRIYMNNIECSWKNLIPGHLSNSQIQTISTVNQRKPPPPLEILGLPGHDKLTDIEKELCSVARIVPTNYLEFKNILITENKKSGSLRLAQARVLLKIDVNKTRKIYDFLVQQGYINKPA
ncbi:transcriptional adapter 2-alpha-like isoform X1 [Chelonus insularis]|uniref:transcriptional adapter 2-alpha-like isoform X1 n=1 Tax=Chelonus insularis TaxID=460826 RepID=UPI00158B4A2D|nr:transcriptional adapter 2-alpha-like isoform X1 [Chelonus insularis]